MSNLTYPKQTVHNDACFDHPCYGGRLHGREVRGKAHQDTIQEE